MMHMEGNAMRSTGDTHRRIEQDSRVKPTAQRDGDDTRARSIGIATRAVPVEMPAIVAGACVLRISAWVVNTGVERDITRVGRLRAFIGFIKPGQPWERRTNGGEHNGFVRPGTGTRPGRIVAGLIARDDFP
ncbi:MAG TPA: hypothetical protein VL424_03630 [Pararobbsia sp.]|nr:hypothetical protein [Pararobbsia sp.]